ncbi:MAG: entericidin A/B family lipoprotein [Alphaproteobacteria bacterium]
MFTQMRILLQLAMIGALALVLGACETIQGAGQDIQTGGEALEETVEGEDADYD